MKVVRRKIKDLRPADYNPRYLTAKAEQDLENSLKKYGLIDPIIINVNKDRKNIVIGGHQRLKIWEKLGNDEIDCIELNLSEADERELNVRLNKNTGDFDFTILKEEFTTIDLMEWGFEDYELGIDIGEEDFNDEREPKEKKDEVTVNKGTIYRVGGSILIVEETQTLKGLLKSDIEIIAKGMKKVNGIISEIEKLK